jgi:acyl-CoA synthetase (AMP-forming)/AMP-acid ligase II
MEFDFATLSEAVAAAIPDRELLVIGKRRFTHAQLAERSRRIGNYLLARGLRLRRERAGLANHESGQDHVALYLYNGPEYLDAMYGCFKARLASVNVNYRYVEEELAYLLHDCGARAIVYHAEFAPRLAAIRDRLPRLEVLLQVADGTGHALLPGAVDYEAALAAGSPAKPPVTPSPDDLYLLYTGGTTGMPRGVMWRSHDAFMAAMGGRVAGSLNRAFRSSGGGGTELASLDDLVARVTAGPGVKVLVAPPLMHGAAQWVFSICMTQGNAVVFSEQVRRFDPDDVLRTIEREKVAMLSLVGDAFARPLLEQMARKSYDLSSLASVGSGGAPLSVAAKRELLERLPHAIVTDGIGSSETGAQGNNVASRERGVSTGDFTPVTGSVVVSEDRSRELEPGSSELGWFAMTGNVPLGYLGDPEKTARTFPVIGGRRYSVPGDRARWLADGRIEVLGRDSVTINSGGEKIFAEEVEAALRTHPDVFDVVVAGRPSARWGEEVVAVVRLCDGARAGAAELTAAASRSVARFKLPKAYVFVDRIERSPSGKADYRWARGQAEKA